MKVLNTLKIIYNKWTGVTTASLYSNIGADQPENHENKEI